MHIGLLTNSLTGVGMDLQSIADWAGENAIHELEVGPAVPMDKALWEKVLCKDKVTIGTMIYCRNFISTDEKEATEHSDALRARINFASEMGVKKVVCSAGQRPESVPPLNYLPEKSLDAYQAFFSEVVEQAEKKDVRICFEMCPWMWNISSSPSMWDELFTRVKSDHLGLCFDPSHLVWQMINPYRVLKKYGYKVYHVHGKDTHVDRDALDYYGVLQNTKWWKHRLPGLGDLDWNRIIDLLYQIGYNGVLSIEHEDPVWEGGEEKVKKGILIARDHLVQFIK